MSANSIVHDDSFQWRSSGALNAALPSATMKQGDSGTFQRDLGFGFNLNLANAMSG
jgi:hypothetical protein